MKVFKFDRWKCAKFFGVFDQKFSVLTDSSDVEKIVEEINLLYVAVTRAREKVDTNKIEESDTLFSGDMRKIIQKVQQNIIPSPDTPKGPK